MTIFQNLRPLVWCGLFDIFGHICHYPLLPKMKSNLLSECLCWSRYVFDLIPLPATSYERLAKIFVLQRKIPSFVHRVSVRVEQKSYHLSSSMVGSPEFWERVHYILAKEHIEMAHQKQYQKRNHDWKSRAANLKVGDQVTTYIPSCCSMLFYNVM